MDDKKFILISKLRQKDSKDWVEESDIDYEKLWSLYEIMEFIGDFPSSTDTYVSFISIDKALQRYCSAWNYVMFSQLLRLNEIHHADPILNGLAIRSTNAHTNEKYIWWEIEVREF